MSHIKAFSEGKEMKLKQENSLPRIQQAEITAMKSVNVKLRERLVQVEEALDRMNQ